MHRGRGRIHQARNSDWVSIAGAFGVPWLHIRPYVIRNPMPSPKILVIPGSLRSGSYNARLAALATKELVLADADVTRISLADYPLRSEERRVGKECRSR